MQVGVRCVSSVLLLVRPASIFAFLVVVLGWMRLKEIYMLIL